MIFYKTTNWDYAKVEPVEGRVASDKFIILSGHRQRTKMRSRYATYFNTELEAWQFLMKKYTNDRDYYLQGLQEYDAYIEQCKAAITKTVINNS